MARDYRAIAQKLIDLSGGPSNISSMTHCMTRLRFIIKDKSKVDEDAIRKTDAVLGTVFKTDELQIILGQNLMNVYNEAAKLGGNIKQTEALDENPDAPKKKEKWTVGRVANEVINFVSAAVTPLVPGLIAGGMLKVFLLLLSYAITGFKDSQMYMLLSLVANMPFFFMPVFVAFGTAKKLGSTPIYAMSVAAALVAPDFVELVKAGEAVHIFGLPVMLVQYQSTMLPALLIGIAAYWIEKFLNKIVPGIFRSVFVGAGTIAISYFLGVTVLGPLGDRLGALISGAFVYSSEHFGFIALAVLTAVLPWLIMTGMHHAISPFMTQFIANPGYDGVFRPAFILHNMAEGGAVLGVALKTKNKAFRSECLSLSVGSILAGVTEPTIYGVNLPLKKPMIGVMAGGAAGGIVAGLLGARAYSMGYSTILALPIFMDTVPAMIAGVVVAIVVACAVTFILGFEDRPADDKKEAETTKEDSNSVKTDITAPADGELISIEDVADPAFSSKAMGDGVAFKYSGDKVTICAPAVGTLSALFPTGHAFGITMDNEVQILVHIGIDTVGANGDGFKLLGKKEDDRVNAGDPIVEVDLKKLGEKYDMTTMLIIPDDGGQTITFRQPGTVKKGESVLA